MSTVIWTIVKNNEETESDETDRPLVYKHSPKLDKLCEKIGTIRLSDFHDNTDMAINVMDHIADEDVDEYKRKNEKWHDIEMGIGVLSSLIQYLSKNETRFGFINKTTTKEMIDELTEIKEWLSERAKSSEGFHLCVVM